jgi:hypothetical protein
MGIGIVDESILDIGHAENLAWLRFPETVLIVYSRASDATATEKERETL